MTFVQARNAIIDGLEAHLGLNVDLSDQISKTTAFPYSYYSVLTPRISRHAFGLHNTDDVTHTREEPVEATLSFTFCSQNRKVENEYVSGEDEAITLAEKALGFFLLNGHCIHTEHGDVVIKNVGSVANRSSFVVTDTVRRYGFDIRFAYVRTDEMPAVTIEKISSPHGDAHS